jgi:diguanylate cyclase (GGDEF)-like protein/PAS domain S-box-containing protein
MNIDIRTLALVTGFVDILQLIAIYLLYKSNKTYRGIGWWLLWSASTAVGFWCMLLRDVIPVEMVSVSIFFTNILLLSGLIFLYVGVMRFLDKKEHRGVIISVFAVFALSTVYVLYAHKDDNVRVLILYTAAAIFSLLAAQGLLVDKTRAFAASAKLVAAVLLANGCLAALRVVAAVTFAPIESVFTPSLMQTASFAVTLIVGSVCTYGLIIMVSQRSSAEMKETRERYRQLVETSHDIIYTINMQGIITFVSPAWKRLLGHDFDAVVGYHFQEFVHPDDIPRYEKFLVSVLETAEPASIEYRIRNIEGDWRWHNTSSVPVINADGTCSSFVGNASDVTERKQLQHKLEEMATHDFLTGLPNRRLLVDRFTVAAALARRNKDRLAVMSLDLDRFKSVNDTFGHESGDQVLVSVSKRLSGLIRASDTVSRIGGDEYILVMMETKHAGNAAAIARKILDSFTQPLSINGHQLPLSTSIGIAIFPEDADDLETLICKSDAALYYAKSHGRNQFKFFSNGDLLVD